MTDTPTRQERQAFIYYWVDYWDDKKKGPWPFLRMHQNSNTMASIGNGDVVWIFARRPKDDAYVMVARHLVSNAAETPESDPERDAGKWFFESNGLGPSGLTLFDPDEQDDAEELIGSLHLIARARPIGLAFQGANAVKKITEEDAETLERHVAARASVNMWGVIQREAKAAEGSDINLRIGRNIAQDLSSLSAMEGLTEQQKTWIRERASWLADRFWRERWKDGAVVCDDCQFDPVSRTIGTDINPRTLMDVHHKYPLQEGYRLTSWRDDFALLCPNCHRFEHARIRLASVKRSA
jgi:hypothetical protein